MHSVKKLYGEYISNKKNRKLDACNWKRIFFLNPFIGSFNIFSTKFFRFQPFLIFPPIVYFYKWIRFNKSFVLNKILKIIISFLFFFFGVTHSDAQTQLLDAIDSPVLFAGDEKTAYRDPAVLYHNDQFYLFFTLVKTENGKIFSYGYFSNAIN